MTTYYAHKEYIYTTGDAIFSIPFSYINKEHIGVSINGEGTSNYTYLNSSQIQILDTLEAGDVVSITRNTPIDNKMVVFSDTSILNKDVQNLAEDQLFNAIQEIYDKNIVFKNDLEDEIADNKAEVEQEIEDFEGEIDQTISEVQEAAEKINALEEAVNTATTAATTATNKATEATNAANRAEAIIPSQTGNNGKFLQTNGSSTQWATVDLSTKQDTLVPGTNIKTINGESILGSGDIDTFSDTVPLFTGMYFDYDPNNFSWVIAGGQVVSGTIYEFTYNELVSELTTPKYNLNVIDVDDMVVGVDYSTYWKVDQTNQTFTCPTRTSERVLVAKKEATDADPTWYNLYSDGWCEQGGITAGGTYQSVSLTRSYLDTSYNITAINGTTNTIGSGTNLALYVDQKAINSFRIVNPNTSTIQPDIWQVSGYTAVPDITDYTEPLRMYFKVANAVQNLELLDAGEVLTAVNNISTKVDNTPHIIDTYENGKSGYIVYSNNYCEQWGYTTSATVALLIPYRDTDYNILMTQGPSSAYTAQIANPTTSSFTYGQYQGAYSAYWRTFGYIS